MAQIKRQLNVTELDFDQIKANLKAYFTRAESPFKDWNFDGSGLSVLLDVLAYNTHYNAFLAHMAINESFIDTAQVRNNVVSHANLLGYVPRSTIAPRAELELSFIASTNLQSNSLILPRGLQFTTSVDGVSYTYVNLTERSTTLDTTNNLFEFTGNKSLSIAQGSLKTIQYVFDSSETQQRFQISDLGIDTTTMVVTVRDNGSSSEETYLPFSSLEDVTGETPVYFITENINGYYEIYFGDGALFGKKPKNLQIITISYVSTLGEVSNGATVFKLASTVDNTIGLPTITNVSVNSSGGVERESADLIRKNAPVSLITQNRAVTVNDYKNIISREYGDVETINVWGGDEENNPEDSQNVAKVYICIKPFSAETLTQTEKQTILSILQNKRVFTLKNEIVDPEYLYIYGDVDFKYNPGATTLDGNSIVGKVTTAVENFGTNILEKFDGVFRYSNFLRMIEDTDPSIVNSNARIFVLKKHIYPEGALYTSSPSTEIDPDDSQTWLRSMAPDSQYEYENITVSFDIPLFGDIEDSQLSIGEFVHTDGFTLRNTSTSTDLSGTYYIADGNRTAPVGLEIQFTRDLYFCTKNLTTGKYEKALFSGLSPSIGKINVNTGEIVLDRGKFPANHAIKNRLYFRAIPLSNDLIPSRRKLLKFSNTDFTYTADIDPISIGGRSTDYTAFSSKRTS